MTSNDLLSLTKRIEINFPVDAWEISDVKIWPIIRIKLLESHSLPQAKKVKKKLTASKLVGYFYSIKFLICLFIKKRKIDSIFSSYSVHKEKIENSYLHKFYEKKFIELKSENKDFLVIEFNEENESPLQKPFVDGNKLFVLYKLFFKNKPWLINHELVAQYNHFLKELGDWGFEKITRNISLEEICNSLKDVLLYRNFFKFLLTFRRPDNVYMVCYYTMQNLGLSLAGADLGIKTAELQHGNQVNYIPYACWLKVPKNGYDLLPQVFMCWDDLSAGTINKWARATNFHIAFKTANPWHELWRDASWIKENFKFEIENLNRPVILYTLSPGAEILPEVIVKVMKLTDSDYIWSVRLHPREHIKIDLLAKISEENNLRLNVSLGSNTPLPYILTLAKAHITEWSSTVIEAFAFGVPSIVLHDEGRQRFESQIPQKYFLFEEKNEEKIIKFLAQWINR